MITANMYVAEVGKQYLSHKREGKKEKSKSIKEYNV
jgi:hypothetical protein